MDRNLLLAVALSIGIYVAWFSYVQPPPKRLPPGAGSKPGATAPVAPESLARPASVAAPRVPPPPVTLRAEGATIRLNAQGAALAGYQYPAPLGPVELIPTEAQPGFMATWPELVFTPESGSRFSAKHPAGFQIDKEFTFGGLEKLSHVKITLRNLRNKPVEVPAWSLNIGPGLLTVPNEVAENHKMWRAVGLLPPPEGKTKPVVESFKPGDYSEPWLWLGVDNRYFLAAVIAGPGGPFERYEARSTLVDIPESSGGIGGLWKSLFPSNEPQQKLQAPAPGLALKANPRTLAPRSVVVYDIPFFIGPKIPALLEQLHPGLDRSVNFGWFDSLGRFMLKVLERLHRITGNYGWSIILLTMMVQLLLSPLTYKSYKAMAGMKKIQPELARLQQKFKDNPQRLHTEMMALYKSKGVNPMGGCLPMLVQMPVFVALFNTLRNAWELHGAPWIGWIHDLSAHDPYYILPVFMGGVMFMQNKANPTVAADPAQAQMMQWMPLIFAFMFLKFPVGVVLYWLTNSLLGFAQQMLLRKRWA